MALRKLNKHMSINEQVEKATKQLLDSGLMAHPTDQNLIREMMNKLDVSGTVFEKDPEAQRLIIDEALKMASDQQRLGALRDFLVGEEVQKQLGEDFDPGQYLNSLSEKIRDLQEERKKRAEGIEEIVPAPVAEEAPAVAPQIGFPPIRKRGKEADVRTDIDETTKVTMPEPADMTFKEQTEETQGTKTTEEISIDQVMDETKLGPGEVQRVPTTPQAARAMRYNRTGQQQAEDQHKDELQKSIAEMETEQYKAIQEKNWDEAAQYQQEQAAKLAQERAKKKKRQSLLSKVNPVTGGVAIGAGIGGTIGGILGTSLFIG